MFMARFHTDVWACLATLIFLAIMTTAAKAASSEQCPVTLKVATDALSAKDWPRQVSSSHRAMSECSSMTDDVWEAASSMAALGLKRMGQYADAVAATDECIARIPSTIACRDEKADALIDLGRLVEAQSTLKSVLQLPRGGQADIKTQQRARRTLDEITTAIDRKNNARLGITSDPNEAFIRGRITENMLHSIASNPLFPQAVIHLDSPGGSVSAAMRIGELVRMGGMRTTVSRYDECSSACVLILAAGVIRVLFDGRIGIHRPSFSEESGASMLNPEYATAQYNETADKVRSYLRRMGMSDDLFTAMLRVPSGQMRYLSAKELQSFGLDGEDPAWAEWYKVRTK
jgi:ATP-dependent protease ClpP protease subunit